MAPEIGFCEFAIVRTGRLEALSCCPDTVAAHVLSAPVPTLSVGADIALSSSRVLTGALDVGSGTRPGVEKPAESCAGSRFKPLVSTVFPPAVSTELAPAAKFCGPRFGTADSGSGICTGSESSTCGRDERTALDATARPFFSNSFTLGRRPDDAFPKGFCALVTSAVVGEATFSFVSAVDRCEAHIAVKLPGLLAARPTKPEAEAPEPLLVFADSMAEVTVRVRAGNLAPMPKLS